MSISTSERETNKEKLNVLLPHKDKGQYDHVRARVILHQTKSKQYTDAKRGARSPKVTVGAAVKSVQARGTWEKERHS